MKTKQPLTINDLKNLGVSNGFKYNMALNELHWC